jgi:hypothetical protein
MHMFGLFAKRLCLMRLMLGSFSDGFEISDLLDLWLYEKFVLLISHLNICYYKIELSNFTILFRASQIKERSFLMI